MSRYLSIALCLVVFCVSVSSAETSIRLKRGVSSNLPPSAPLGEPLYTTDDHNVYIGNGPGVAPSKVSGVNVEVQAALNALQPGDIGAAPATVIDARDYGAVAGDAGDNTTATVAALSAASALAGTGNGVVTVLFPKDGRVPTAKTVYRFVSGAIAVPSNVAICFQGTEAHIASHTSASVNDMLPLFYTAAPTQNVYIIELTIRSDIDSTRWTTENRTGRLQDAPSSLSSNITGLSFANVTNLQILRYHSVNLETGLRITGSTNVHIGDFKSEGGPQPIYMHSTTNVTGNTWVLDCGDWTSNKDHQIYFDHGLQHVKIDKTILTGGTGSVFQISSSTGDLVADINIGSTTIDSVRGFTFGRDTSFGSTAISGVRIGHVYAKLDNVQSTSNLLTTSYDTDDIQIDNLTLLSAYSLVVAYDGTAITSGNVRFNNVKILSPTGSNTINPSGFNLLAIDKLSMPSAKPVSGYTFYSPTTGVFGKMTVTNSDITYNWDGTGPNSISGMYRMRGNGVSLLDNVRIVNTGTTSGYWTFTDTSGATTATNIYLSGYTTLVHSGDTQVTEYGTVNPAVTGASYSAGLTVNGTVTATAFSTGGSDYSTQKSFKQTFTNGTDEAFDFYLPAGKAYKGTIEFRVSSYFSNINASGVYKLVWSGHIDTNGTVYNSTWEVVNDQGHVTDYVAVLGPHRDTVNGRWFFTLRSRTPQNTPYVIDMKGLSYLLSNTVVGVDQMTASSVYQFSNTQCTASAAPYACCTGATTGTCSGAPAQDTVHWAGLTFNKTTNTTQFAGPVATTALSVTAGGSVTSASTISPSGAVFHVTGTAAIATINLPFAGFTGAITIIPDAAFTTTTAGNIGVASTAVVGKALVLTYDGTKWYPNY